MSEQSQLRHVKLDTSLKSFSKLWNMFMQTKDRIEKNDKVVAKWRNFPPEIIYTLGGTPYDLLLHEGLATTTTRDVKSIGYAIEAGLSADSCPWNLTAAAGILPRKNSAPINMFLAAAGQCDISAKSWQIMSRNTGKPLYSMEIPAFHARSEKRSISFIEGELLSLFERLGRRLGRQYSESRLRNEIKRGNRIRSLLLDLTALLSHRRSVMTSLEYFLTNVTAGDYLQDPDHLASSLTEIKNEVEARSKEGESPHGILDDPIRIYYLGMAPQDLRLWNIIDSSGGSLVGCDTYLSLFSRLIPESGAILREFARWIWMMPHHMPSIDRAKALIQFVKQQKPDAIIIGNVIGCRNLSSSDRIVKETLREELGIPITSIEFGSSDEDVPLLEPQIRAFVEMCR